jgi:hypothetical protein
MQGSLYHPVSCWLPSVAQHIMDNSTSHTPEFWPRWYTRCTPSSHIHLCKMTLVYGCMQNTNPHSSTCTAPVSQYLCPWGASTCAHQGFWLPIHAVGLVKDSERCTTSAALMDTFPVTVQLLHSSRLGVMQSNTQPHKCWQRHVYSSTLMRAWCCQVRCMKLTTRQNTQLSQSILSCHHHCYDSSSAAAALQQRQDQQMRNRSTTDDQSNTMCSIDCATTSPMPRLDSAPSDIMQPKQRPPTMQAYQIYAARVHHHAGCVHRV